MKPSIHICRVCERSLIKRPAYRTLRTSPFSSPRPQPPTFTDPIPPLRDIQPSQLSYYWDTLPPTDLQLQFADNLFTPTRHGPLKLWSAAKFRTTPLSSIEPEVAFLGRSNVGKSSLLNAIMGKEMCWTSSKPGRTREMNAFGIGGTKGGESKIVLLDMPGYGKASRAEWGSEIIKYLQGRKQLRRAFLLIDAEHGLKTSDRNILSLFRQSAIPHQIILSKVDKLLSNSTSKATTIPAAARLTALHKKLYSLRPKIQPDGRTQGPGALGELLTCSAGTALGEGRFLGVSAVRWAIVSAAGLDGGVEGRVEGIVPHDTLPVGTGSSGLGAQKS
ncbi:P-loop containing nucleoside triphosphate hydrolase protein [Aspergillus karnatakaensis]|uniref:translation initiation/elongation factor MRX8 n=1 Tax=Aspergillus karnatakaensis TaxID=1810916 RepID=UPI003CCDED34